MNGIGGGGRRFFRPSTKDRDEDLHLFREMHRRDKERIISLLQPVSDEFEHNSGNSQYLYRIASATKGFGFESITERDKNDYDWLKTPPATPLFPSLEMEAHNASELIIQREIPIIQPLSRFSGNLEASKINFGSKSPTPKSKVPSRSVTPSGKRPNVSSTDSVNIKGSLVSNHKASDFNPSKTTGKDSSSSSKPPSRGVSPLVRSRLPAIIPGFSDETPPNLITDRDRSSSASRSRPTTPNNATITIHARAESANPRRQQSCSPSPSRGRRMDFNQEKGGDSIMERGKNQVGGGGGNGSLVFGSKMVERVVNARKSVVVSDGEEREAKLKVGALGNENSGFGRIMPRNSFDNALKQMERRRETTNSRQGDHIKSSLITSNYYNSNSSESSSPRTTKLHSYITSKNSNSVSSSPRTNKVRSSSTSKNSNSESSSTRTNKVRPSITSNGSNPESSLLRTNKVQMQQVRNNGTRNQESWKQRKETRKFPMKGGENRSNWGLCRTVGVSVDSR